MASQNNVHRLTKNRARLSRGRTVPDLMMLLVLMKKAEMAELIDS